MDGKEQTDFKDLAALIEGDVLTDELNRTIYSSGASLYRVKPLAIVKPRHKADVVQAVRYAAERSIPITPRGGGSSRTGNEVGGGILLDFCKGMNGILEFNRDEGWVRVQPGLVLAALNKFLKPHRLFFPIDPSTKDHCTLGGMIANNSSGPHAVNYGATRDYVLSLEVVLATGEVITTGPAPLKEKNGPAGEDPQTLEQSIPGRLDALLQGCGKALEDEKPFTMKNSCGYDLWRLRGEGTLDLTSLFVGSEGTLGVITEAKIRVVPVPGKTLGCLVYFDNLDHVGAATQKILELAPTMVEIIERQILDLARTQKAEMRPYLPEGIEALLFVEFEEKDEEGLRRRLNEVEEAVIRRDPLAVGMKAAKDQKDMAMLEKVRSISGPILNRVKGPKKPVAFIEDAAVHPSLLSEYIKGLRTLFKEHGADASIYGHAGDGNLHLMVFLDLTEESEVRKMVSLAEAAHDLVLSLKGTVSAEHGDGRLRTHYLRKQYPRLYPVMAEIKKLFDPRGLFNPGCIVADGPNLLDQSLKSGGKGPRVPLWDRFDKERSRAALETCSGCGKCRSYCPIGQQVPEEWAIGRAKATLLREIASGGLDASFLEAPEFKDVMDSCVNCKRCLTDCPSGVDIPWLALSARANYVEKHGEPLAQRFFSNTRALCGAGSALAPLANLANSLAPARRVMEAALGVDRRRYLPPFQRKTLTRMLKDRPRSSGTKQVVYFLSCYSNFNEPEGDGLATLEVLERNGHEVLIPDFHCCGIARINTGAIRPVMKEIRDNVKKMASFVDRGLPIVFSEPSCTLAVKMEYPKILHSEEALKVAGGCYDIHQYLWSLHQKGELNLKLGRMDLDIGYHNPCHLRALGVVQEPVELLRLIPAVKAQAFSDGCCGLVGTFGMKKKNFDLSMAIGDRLFKEVEQSRVNQVSTSCGACKLQIIQGTGKVAAHPISLLAQAYRDGSRT
jgi:anaerobic glycerol-3-phosphate dehydrogenase C subunit